MIDFINRHYIVLNPITVLVAVHVALAVTFTLLGWEE